ncbi:DEAD/DEAH box helicase family protein [Desulfovibrio inopinatus]|uniref:DEAD/DEAH box helicase family protein n=1 Tax=Desulfovibrio inopinatus TaxID=102109 RepID=UPI00041A71C8|nr:DEAD/DEAH box helicase family protein [Desulfovibrio inopinatus]
MTQFAIKTGKFSKKVTWGNIRPGDISSYIAGIHPSRLAGGQEGIWIGAKTQNGSFWPILDVESDDHENVAENIRAAQTLLCHLSDLELLDGLEILATGRGFRFVWPVLIPHEYGSAFLELLKDLPGVDAAPTKSGNPIRLFAYRGHRKQGGDLDRHDHMLSSWVDLTDAYFDAAAYCRLVAGKPDPHRIAQWATRIAPVNPLSEPWTRLLQSYQRRVTMKRNVVSFRRPRKVGINWEQILAAAAPYQPRPRHTPYGEMYTLNACPVCGRKDKAWISSNGRLKCWRSSCEAAVYDGGLHPAQWVEGYEGTTQEMESFHDVRQHRTLDDARSDIHSALHSHEDIVLRVDPGVGKTFAAIRYALHEAQHKLVLFTLPTNGLAEEMEQAALDAAQEMELGGLVNILALRGRTPGSSDRRDEKGQCIDATCYRYGAVKQAADRGFSPALTVCATCPHNPKRKGCLDVCPYYDSAKIPPYGLIFTSHQKAAALPDDVRSRVDVWLVDENPVRDMIENRMVLPGALDNIAARLPGKSARVIEQIAQCANELLRTMDGTFTSGRLYATTPPAQWGDAPSLWSLCAVSEEERQRLADDLDALYGIRDNEKPGAWQQRIMSEDVSLAALRWLWTALGDQHEEKAAPIAYVHVRRHHTQPIEYRTVRNIAPDMAQARLVVLDGTGDKTELDMLFGRTFHEVDGSVDMSGRRVWLRVGLGKLKARKMNPAALRRKLEKCLHHLKPTDQRVLIATHLAIEDTVLDMARSIDPDREFATIHYWNSQGTNQYAQFDAVIAFGTPTPNKSAVYDHAATLFDDKDQQGAWMERLGQRDLVQALHRIRPIHGEKTVIVMGSSWPTVMGAPVIYDQRQGKSEAMSEAITRARTMMDGLGVYLPDLMPYFGVGFRGRHKEVEAALAELNESAKTTVCILIQRFLRIHTTENGLSRVILSDTHAASSILEAMKQDGHPELRWRLKGSTYWNNAVGYIEAFMDVCQALGIDTEQLEIEGKFMTPADDNVAGNVLYARSGRHLLPDSSLVASHAMPLDTTRWADPPNGMQRRKRYGCF